MVIAAWAKALIALCEAPMPAASETLPALESCLAERLLDFDFLDEVWPRGRTAIERAGIGRQREDALSGIVALRDRIVTARAETLVDAAVQLRRLAVEAETEALSLRGLPRSVSRLSVSPVRRAQFLGSYAVMGSIEHKLGIVEVGDHRSSLFCPG